MIFFLVEILVLSSIWFGFRVGFFVFDRKVFDFQINPILRSGEIKNINQYRIVHNYLEMKFEENPNEFERNDTVEKLNAMMGNYPDQE